MISVFALAILCFQSFQSAPHKIYYNSQKQEATSSTELAQKRVTAGTLAVIVQIWPLPQLPLAYNDS